MPEVSESKRHEGLRPQAQPSATKPVATVVPTLTETFKSADPSAGAEARLDAGLDHIIADHAYAARYAIAALPKSELAETSLPARFVHQSIMDMMLTDSNPRLNLASFVTTWMEPEADELLAFSRNVNLVDMEQYPSCTEMQNRCVAMLAHLYNAPDPKHPTGTAAIGSSEAIMLGGLAMKKRWQKRRRDQGLSTEKPNLVMGYNVQVVWEKFCRYFDVEERFVPLEVGCYVATPEGAKKLIDENTIGVVGILGSTYNGEFEDIEGMNAMVDEIRTEKGWDIPIHVDAASGGFVAPFAYPDLIWDFQLPNVKSINVSGHKYGLVYPGIGWVLWREPEDLPEDMIFVTNYLGSNQPSVTLNFSRPASQIVAQYYQFLRLGKNGYRAIVSNLLAVAKHLREGILETGHFVLLSDDHSLPLVAFAFKKNDDRVYDEFDLAERLRERGWTLPAYTMAPNAKDVKLLRAVVREDLSMSRAEKLVDDICWAVDWLEAHMATLSKPQMRKMKHSFQSIVRAAMKQAKLNPVC